VISPRLAKFRREADLWSASTFVLGLIIISPIALVLFGLFREGPKWDHMASTVLGSYLTNTFILIATVSIFSILFAIIPAWLVSTCEFSGRRIFEWALVMPLALPTYVAAFVYFQVPDAAIPLLIKIRTQFGPDAFLLAEKILRYGVLSIAMAGVLFPYLFISARASFSQQSKAVIEASRMLGKSSTQTFFKVALPLSRPAIVAGLSLILMEVINDYGAVNFFGVPTLTEGIFRTWFGLQDRASAVRLAGLAMVAVFIILAIERGQRGNASFSENSQSAAPLARRKLSRRANLGAFLVCFIPLLIGLILPTLQLISWSAMTFEKVLKPDFVAQFGRSIGLALGAAIALTAVAVLFAYAAKLHPVRWLRTANRVSTIGYASPGAVIAIGVMVLFGAFDKMAGSAVISGTLLAIGFAYLVRFLTVAYQPIDAGLTRVCGRLDECSRTLGKLPLATLFKINLPLIKGTLLAATMLVFVDILKELPLTLILRPANFDTLATTAFSLAKEGRIQECAVPSLIIVIAGMVGLGVLNRLLKPRHHD